MPRTFFRTSLVHHCHSPELGEPRPTKCKCRKLISRAQAHALVEMGAATSLIDYSGPEPVRTWNIVLFGRVAKTPRAHTIEKAHIERGLEASDHGELMERVGRAADGYEEDIALFEHYYDLEIRNRLRLFRGCGEELENVKTLSDSTGIVTGKGGKKIVASLVRLADSLKSDNYFDEEFEKGRPVLLRIGLDERTSKTPRRNR